MNATIRDNPGDSTADIPERIGPYCVLCFLQWDDTWSVCMAVRRDGSFKRRVAIKVLRKGIDTHDVLRRFELERQIVTAFNHTNTVRVFVAWQAAGRRSSWNVSRAYASTCTANETA